MPVAERGQRPVGRAPRGLEPAAQLVHGVRTLGQELEDLEPPVERLQAVR